MTSIRTDPRLIAKIKIAQKQLAMDDDDYRSLLLRLTGQSSARVLSATQAVSVLDAFKRLGWVPTAPRPAVKASPKPHVRMVFALWGECDRSGAIEDGSRKALTSFVRRQTGIDNPDWLTAAQANKVTEGLKAMLRRRKDAAKAQGGAQ